MQDYSPKTAQKSAQQRAARNSASYAAKDAADGARCADRFRGLPAELLG